MSRKGMISLCTAGLAALVHVSNVTADDGGMTGKQVFNKWCAPCHAAGIKDHPGTLALSIKYQGQKSPVLEEWTDLTPELIEFFVRNGVSIMPFFRKTEISDAQLELLAAYLANAGKQQVNGEQADQP